MKTEEIVTLNEDFDDFLYKVVKNYDIGFSEVAGVFMAKMVRLAIDSNNCDVLLMLMNCAEMTIREKDGNH
jgi:hypothetical protein